MKIAILGNGKMGKRISELAIKKGHSIVCISDSKTPAKSLDLSIADVAIDFSTPTAAFENISHAINSGIPIISGTTAWLDKLQNINDLCIKKEGAFLYASNFSLGVNIFFELNKKLATLMKNQSYESKIHEIHHTQKLDSPSGTAITLAVQMNEILMTKTKITADRIDDIPGTHQITYSSKVDEIEIKHTANNRDGFAMGAIIAAEWIIGKKGIYSMKDVLAQ
ncbi:MAG: 4-hydroxy-tetrahydrodipicolinate reductase [Bacteroidetes bacterium]|nr:4-hydroxy-tetrahydrodipicolinate reductase [Bacteroidota bacterium]